MNLALSKKSGKNGIISAILFILLLIIGNFCLYGYNRLAFFEGMKAKEEVTLVEKTLEFLWAQVQIADLGIRGYLLVPKESMAVPLMESTGRYPKGFEDLERMLLAQHFDIGNIAVFKKLYIAKMDEALLMKKLRAEGKTDEAVAILEKDSGYNLWLAYKPFSEKVLAFEKNIKNKAEYTYQKSLTNTLIIQIILLVLSMPILGLVIYRLHQNDQQKKVLFSNLKENNKKYLFCDSEKEEKLDEDKIISQLIYNLQSASQFVKDITKGNYDVQWDGIDNSNAHLNTENLTGNLLQMREQMKKVKEEDRKRLWANEGFARFSDLLSVHGKTFEEKMHVFIAELIKYTGANQGALFIAGKDTNQQSVLELITCYAYGKRKFHKKTIYAGDGLVGQAFREKDTILLTDIPADYIKITSGLGQALPGCVLIVPLRNNEDVVGVLEIASFQIFEAYQIQFIEKLLESLSTTIVSANSNESTRLLLEESQRTTEQMRSQEEEMRQNLEELAATQEEMQRKEQEYLLVIDELREQKVENNKA